ncbi:MAG: hypothetical protein WC860_06380 [Candidatus Margulisiibacteriota bacterium]|jgi:hypothetical protein
MEDENKIEELKHILKNIQQQLDLAKKVISGKIEKKQADSLLQAREKGSETESEEGKVIEGVFNGEKMIGPDGKEYNVPPNYASKSKLVEGDMLKLTILPNGSFLFKQIGPIERDRIVGTIYYDEEKKQFLGRAESGSYKLLTAPVTYFKGATGDEIIMLIPKEAQSAWAAVENIIKKEI